MSTTPKFKICLTMAGAVSAGAFTAGVMDYLLESLELWEKAKARNRNLGLSHPEYDHSVPMHEVELDVISGSSAGGITGSLTMLNLVDANYQPVNKDNPEGINNRFYQSWVVMADQPKASTFTQMLSNSDLKALAKNEKPQALLNSEPIDFIANHALKVDQYRAYPSYISDSLDLLLTTTNLRGINFKVDFGGNDKNGPIITSHAGFFRYKLENELYPAGIPPHDELYYVLKLSDYKHMQYLKDATLSTAAFPIGLKSREVAIAQEYVNRFPNYLFGKREGIYPILHQDSVYRFNSIDGGLINNEPFALALKIMHEKNPREIIRDRYAVIMIDPFPNKDHDIASENPKADMVTVAKGMFKALRNQVMFNQDGILEAIELKDRTKFLIEPIRKVNENGEWVRAGNDLASAPFSGFAGFMHQRFRHHDFHLGRLNCQTFLRYYFGVEQPHIQDKLGAVPTDAAFDRYFIYADPKDESSPKIFPIIPDMRVTQARNHVFEEAQYGSDAKLSYPTYPKVTTSWFESTYQSDLKKRIELVANQLVNHFWFNVANRLFIRNKVSNEIKRLVLEELREAGLLRD